MSTHARGEIEQGPGLLPGEFYANKSYQSL